MRCSTATSADPHVVRSALLLVRLLLAKLALDARKGHHHDGRAREPGRRRRPGLRRAAARGARGRGRPLGGRLRRRQGPRRPAAPGRASSTTSPTPTWQPSSRPAATGRRRRRATSPGSTSPWCRVPTPLRDGAPDLRYIEDAARTARPAPAAGAASSSSRRRTRAPPRRCSRRSWRRDPACGPAPTSTLGYSPERIDPSNPTGGCRTRPKIVSGIDEASLGAVDRLLRHRGRPHRARPRDPRGGAGQAAGEHLPARQHRARQRAGRCTPRARHRRLGGHRRGGDEAVRVHEVHARARASAGTACRSTRRTCRGRSAGRSGARFRFVELANDVNDHMPDYVVTPGGRAAQPPQRWPSTAARSCCSASPTSGTRATPASRRPSPSRSASPTWARAVRGGPADRRRGGPGRGPAGRLHTRDGRGGRHRGVLTDHDEIDWELLERHSDKVLDTRNRLTTPGVDKL